MDVQQLIKLHPGDILIVKLGDPNTAWIPGAEHEARIRKQLDDALEQRGLRDQVSVVVTHYAVHLSVLRAHRQGA